MSTLPQLARLLQTVLSSDADAAAHTSGFVQRQSKLTGALFVQTLVFGWLANAQATLENLCQTAAIRGVRISPQGLDQRFTPHAATYLHQVLQGAVRHLVHAQPVDLALFQRFNGIYVLDSSTIVLPDDLATVWPGCGGRSPVNTSAAIKLQICWELTTGSLHGLEWQTAREHDTTAALPQALLPAGAWRIADLGYFDLDTLATSSEHHNYWLTRLHHHAKVYDADGGAIDLLERLQATSVSRVEWTVLLGARHRLPARLLAERVPQEVADQRRRRLRYEARKKGQQVSERTLRLAAWTIVVTNTSAATLSISDAFMLLRMRWQIELLFKVWKSHGRIDEWRSRKPWRVLCEVYAKVLAMVVQHWVLVSGSWCYADRSLFKAAQTVQHHAWYVASSFDSQPGLVHAFRTITRCLAYGCRLNKRRQQPSTYQRLLALELPLLA